MIGQPIAAGPDGSLGNVVRIANLCFPILTLVIFYIFDFSNFFKNKIIFLVFIFGLFFGQCTRHFPQLKYLYIEIFILTNIL